MSLQQIASLELANGIAFGCLSKKERFTYEFIPFKMSSPLDDEIRIKILYTGICQFDIEWSSGGREGYIPIVYPNVPGHAIVGEVILKGKAVKNVEIGDIIAFGITTNSCGNCQNCLDEKENMCQNVKYSTIFNLHFGGWASHYQGKAKFSVKIPKEIPLELCPPLLCSGVSLYTAIKNNVKNGY